MLLPPGHGGWLHVDYKEGLDGRRTMSATAARAGWVAPC